MLRGLSFDSPFDVFHISVGFIQILQEFKRNFLKIHLFFLFLALTKPLTAMKTILKKQAFVIVCLFITPVCAQDMTYRVPPEEIREIVMAASSPGISISHDNQWMLLLARQPFVSVEELASPELRLAGVRINPANFGESRLRYYSGIELMNIASQEKYPVDGLPNDALISNMSWSPDSKYVAFTVTGNDGIYLWSFSVEGKKAEQVTPRRLNGLSQQRSPLVWISDQEIVTIVVPSDLKDIPPRPLAPAGPVIQESTGVAAPARTYQDLLKDKYDEQLFDHYFTSRVARIRLNGSVNEIGRPVMNPLFSVSPDKNYLLVTSVHKPYSYLVPVDYFPEKIEVWDLNGSVVKEIADNPLIILSSGYDVTFPYPRNHSWRSDKPATLYWVEAQDEGDPRKNKVAYMDIAYQLEAPFSGNKSELVRTQKRFGGIQWGNDQLALFSEYSGATRNMKIYRFYPGDLSKAPELIIDRSMDDEYNNPGNPVTVRNAYGQYVLYADKKNNTLMMSAQGASDEGDMPYLSRFDLTTKQKKMIWRCEAPYYESVAKVIDPEKEIILTSRESVENPLNYYKRDIRKKTITQLTAFPNPYPFLAGVKKEKISYKRADGVDLTATVYLPAGYDPSKDGRLPVLMWAYPREFKSASDATQVRGSKYRFTTINYGSPVFWVTRGYAVMDNVEMPIVGEKGVEPNDTFIEQLTLNAEAAIDVIDKMGVGDRNRVAIGGHSYGAFMTANLLTHTNLFKAGIARSGAYNRTLTPFGFQAETRTYWEAPEVYNVMSPFMYADRLKGALLLIHGDADNNSGTFHIQSERFFNALKGQGAVARFVSLPHESHGYAARENILHMLYETDAWLEKYVKNAD